MQHCSCVAYAIRTGHTLIHGGQLLLITTGSGVEIRLRKRGDGMELDLGVHSTLN